MEKTFGKILEQVLSDRGITQRWLADASNTTEATISRYIHGVNKSPDVDILVDIARALNVSTDFLLGATDQESPRISIPAEERILLSAYRKISDRDSAVLWQLLDPYLSAKEKTLLSGISQASKDSKIG